MISKNQSEITDPIAQPDEGAKEETSAETLESIYQNIVHSVDPSEESGEDRKTTDDTEENKGTIRNDGEDFKD